MKTKMEIQYSGKNAVTTDIEKAVKEAIKEQGVKMNTIETLDIYYQPDTRAIYYRATLKDGTELTSDAIIME